MRSCDATNRYLSAMAGRGASSHRVAVLVADGVSLAELGQAGDVLRAANDHLPDRLRYEVVVCTARPGSVRTREGHELDVPTGLDAIARARTLLLPGCWPVATRPAAAVLDAVVNAHRRGARIVATCTGVAVVAAAGLVDGRTATTHWWHVEGVRRAYPRVDFVPDVLHVDHGDVVTGAGNAAGLDLYLHLVEVDHGAEVATGAARLLVGPHVRAGDRPQLLARPITSAADDAVAVVVARLSATLHHREPLATAARSVGLSERTLRRRFHEQLGTTPGKWLMAERLRHARRLLEATNLPVDAVAQRVGLMSATALRRQFHRTLALTPSAYRSLHRARS